MTPKERVGATGGVAGSSSPDLLRRLSHLLRVLEAPQQEIDAELAQLAAEHGQETYSEIVYLLAHLRFSPEEARGHWRRIAQRRGEMEKALGEAVDVRVALISYFVEVARKFDNPTVIEMKLLEQTEALAYRDELTGLRNFRFFQEFLRRELARTDRYGGTTSLVFVDIDDFKGYNDSYGHEAGNRALTEIARLLTDSVRSVDLVARYGGEEFVVVVPSTPKLGAQKLAENVRGRIEKAFARRGREWSGGRLTASFGVATYPADGEDGPALMRNADRALYLAKSQGKNQVQLYEHSRRSFRRVPLELEGRFLVPTGPEHALRTLDASASGLRFASQVEVPLGTLVDLVLTVPGTRRELRLAGRAVQSRRREDEWEAAVHFLGMSAQDRKLLKRLIRKRD